MPIRGLGNPTEPGRRLQGRYLTELVDSVDRYLSMLEARQPSLQPLDL